MLDPWDCTDRAFDQMCEEAYNRNRSIRNRKKERGKMISRAPASRYRELDKRVDKFMNIYEFELGDRFYLYDTFVDKYVMEVTHPRKGAISYSPAVFTIINPKDKSEPFIKFYDDSNDERSLSVLKRLCQSIVASFARDIEMYSNHQLDKELFQYKIIRFGNMGPTELKKNSFIEYKDDTEDPKSIEEMIRSVCQLYNIFPGRSFYIYNIEEKIYRSETVIQDDDEVRVLPVKFTYENNDIESEKPEESEYIKTVFRQIYEDFFIRNSGATKYRLVRSDRMKEKDLAGYSVVNMKNLQPIIKNPLEIKLIENGIKRDNEYYNHFYLRACALNKDSWNVLAKLDGNSLIMIEFMYDADDGLVATNIDMFELDVSKLKSLEEEILTGELVPVDIDTWHEKMKKSKQAGLCISSFDMLDKKTP